MRIVQFNHNGLVVHCVTPDKYSTSGDVERGLRLLAECAAPAATLGVLAGAAGQVHTFLALADDDPRQPNPGDRLDPVTGAFAPCPVWTAAKAAQEQAERDEADAEQRRSDALDALLAQAAK